MKLPNTKDLEGVKMFFRRKWYELSRSNARFFAFGLATGTFFTLLFLRFIESFGTIHEALVAVDSGGRIQYFTSIGAAVLGVLAITFSLAVFALQHAAEHGSVRILEAFGNSRRVLFDYVLIGSIAFLVYILGLTPQQNSYFTSISLLLSLALIIVVLWRVFAFYKFIVKFINPIEQIRGLSREAKKKYS